MKKIEIMGCGYIGLPTAITFTLAGYEVCGFDVKDTVVDTLNAGHIHIVEPGLQDAMTKAMATGRLHFTTKPEPADVFIICVQTPYRETEEHKRVSDMRFVESAAKVQYIQLPILAARISHLDSRIEETLSREPYPNIHDIYEHLWF